MNSEEILKAAQAEKKDGEYENRIKDKSALISIVASLFVIAVMFYFEYLVFHRFDYGKPAIILLISSVSDIFCGIKLKNKKNVILGAVCGFLFIICIIMYVGALIK